MSTRDPIMLWSSEEESDKESSSMDKEEDEMTIAEFSQYRRRSKSLSTSPRTPNHFSLVPLNRDEESSSYRQKRVLTDHSKSKLVAKERAEGLKQVLDSQYPNFPSFVKSMLHSQISSGFWMGLPSSFCKSHLPKEDVMVTLVDETEEVYEVKYLALKIGLSAGWRRFSIAHNLVEGDALLFQLVKPTEFQVYIFRAYSMAEVDGLRKNQSATTRPRTCERTAQRCRRTLPFSTLQQPRGKSRGNSKNGHSEAAEGIRHAESNIEFKDVTSLKNFIVVVNGTIIDSELSDQTRTKYYELCCGQGAFLHDSLLKGTNTKLAAGLISQTVDIADTMRACKLRTFKDDFTTFDNNLSVLDAVGMKVEFLQARLRILQSLAIESEEAEDSKRYREARTESANVKDGIKYVKEKLIELEKTDKKLDREIETLKLKAERRELKFQEVVNSPL